ncbi:TRAP transporter substrate-binding protein [Sandaracinobacter neustonicus]|uniref:TRAP transporter substrate-binding protein n=1 Tax=Sandaracinobacter neustonicus TaxID=1715348 RepID=A0A501XIX7_9SPHN|nr:TRAP transporter substrate-binding protein [Sandaracinobacter neustonicus]TPE60592.1 TRAP transporter substrate-binding protein [Sandaracinobacter neustonicus]
MSRTVTRRALLGSGIAATAALAAPHAADAAIRLDAVDVHPPGYPTVEAVKWMGEELARESGGRIRIRQFPSGQLGAEDDTLGFARYHAIHFCRVAVAALNNPFPETRALALPYVFRSTDHMRRVVDGPVGTGLLNVFERRGLVGLAYYDAAPRSFYNIRGPIETPADLAGLKIRSPLSDMVLETLAAMGANPTPLSFGGVFSALETHLIDGAENNLPSFESSRHFETARFWSETEHSFSPDALLMSKSAFDALTPADRELVKDVARRSVQVMRQGWDARVAEARRIVLAAGVAINRPDPAPFAAAVEPVVRRYIADPVLGDLYNRIRTEG